MSMVGRVHSVEIGSTVDGPGMRYVVFLQGCLFRCIYCHNRDTWDVHAGEERDIDSVLEDVRQYASFLRPNGGGVTASGGEPLLQARFVQALFQGVHALGLTTCLDTNGFAPHFTEAIAALVSESDTVLLDIKHPENAGHRRLTGQDNDICLRFARYVSEQGKPLVIRCVLVEGFNTDDQTVGQWIEMIQGLRGVVRVELIPYHELGRHKWASFGERCALDISNVPNPAAVSAIAAQMRAAGLPVAISP